jgi:hypothetical protein
VLGDEEIREAHRRAEDEQDAADEQAELDKIAGTCGISAGTVVQPDEQKKLLDAAAQKLQEQAALAQKAEQDALLKQAGGR